MTALLWSLLSAAAGGVEVRSLARTAAGRSGPFALLFRFSLVGGVLGLGAWAGHLWAGVLGWLFGFGVAVFALQRGFR